MPPSIGLLIALTGCGGGSGTMTTPPSPKSYALAASALAPNSVTPGKTATSSISLTPANGYTGNVTLSCSISGGGTPAPTCSFSPNPVAITGTAAVTAILTVSTFSSTPAASYAISGTGKDSSGIAPSNGPQALSLAVASPSYTLAATALNPSSVVAGNAATASLTVTPANSYTGSVIVSCSSITGGGAPQPTCSFSANPVVITDATPGTTTLTVATSSSTPPATYAINLDAADAVGLAPSNGPQWLQLTTTPTVNASIQHIVIIFQENRSPDNLFQDPVLIANGADIQSSGLNSKGQVIPLSPIDLGTLGSNPQTYDLGHLHHDFVVMYDNGKMDGADRESCYANCPPNPQFMYVKPQDVQPYFSLAEQYTFGDRMFQTNQGPSFPAHQFIISGTSAPTASSTSFAAENPNNGGGVVGCLAPPDATVPIIDASGNESSAQYPCFEHPTLIDEFDAEGISWRYYTPEVGIADGIWTGPNAIQHLCQPQTQNGKLVCTGPDWSNVPTTTGQVITDISKNQLPQVSWVIPNGPYSDHSGANNGSGPSWVASIVNAIGNSAYWSNTAIIITWDDWGGWYDHVAPRVINDDTSWGSGYVYGFRVPLIVVSPYARAGYISHVTHDFGSILRFIEETFSLSSVGYADVAADNLSDCFNFSQTPIKFQPISAPLSADYFLNDTSPPVAPDND
jgi:phospholipase C